MKKVMLFFAVAVIALGVNAQGTTTPAAKPAAKATTTKPADKTAKPAAKKADTKPATKAADKPATK